MVCSWGTLIIWKPVKCFTYDADRMEWDFLETLQPSEWTCNFHSPRFPFLLALQVLIEVFANGNPHCIVFESSIRITE